MQQQRCGKQEPVMNKASSSFDISRFMASSTSLVHAVQVCMPKTAFRIHPDRNRTVSNIYIALIDGKWWMIASDVVEDGDIDIPNLWRADLYEGIRPDGQRFILPVTLPIYVDATDWHDSLTHVVKLARKKWISVKSDKSNHCFDVISEKPIKMTEDAWPMGEFESLLELAFYGRIIYTLKEAVTKLRKPSRREINEDDDT
jgi:hypothetical protein